MTSPPCSRGSRGFSLTLLLRHWLNQYEAKIPNYLVGCYHSQGVVADGRVFASPLFAEALKAEKPNKATGYLRREAGLAESGVHYPIPDLRLFSLTEEHGEVRNPI